MGKQTSEAIFETQDFRFYIRTWASSRARGEYRKIAEKIEIHTTLLSQVLSGQKCFTEEQAEKICDYMKLDQHETDFFIKLVQYERAGTEGLKRIYKRQLEAAKRDRADIKSRVPEATELSEVDRSTFYSSWHYSVIRLLTSIEEFQSCAAIARRLDLPLSRVQAVLDFLVSRGLCIARGKSYLRTGRNTHVGRGSPMAIQHHQNWRMKSLSHLERMDQDDLAFTSPVSVSKSDFLVIKEMLRKRPIKRFRFA